MIDYNADKVITPISTDRTVFRELDQQTSIKKTASPRQTSRQGAPYLAFLASHKDHTNFPTFVTALNF